MSRARAAGRRHQRWGALADLAMEVVGHVPMSTTEVVAAIGGLLSERGARSDIRGVLVELPTPVRCRCGHEHECSEEWPLGAGLLKPQLERLARAGLLTKVSRGTARSCLWLRAEAFPDVLPSEWSEPSA